MLGVVLKENSQTLVIDDLTPEGTAIKRSWWIAAWESAGTRSQSDWFAPASSKFAQELKDLP